MKAFSFCICKNNCFKKPWLICYILNIPNPLCRYKEAVCSVCQIMEYMNIKCAAFLLLKEGPQRVSAYQDVASQCGPQTNSFPITWECVKDVNSWVLPQICGIKHSRGGTQLSVF